jgi:outer membrane immunogenic protein
MVKKIVLIGLLLAATFTFASTTYAGGLTFGAKMGPMQIDGVSDDPTNAGVSIGSEMGIVLGDLGFEGEFTTTMEEGNQNIDIDTIGFYATYRTPGFVYFKARGGFVNWDVNGIADDTVTSLGFGIGFSLALIKFELEFTQIDDDIDFISLGVQF